MTSDPSALTAAYFHLCCIAGGSAVVLASLVIWAALYIAGRIDDEF